MDNKESPRTRYVNRRLTFSDERPQQAVEKGKARRARKKRRKTSNAQRKITRGG